MVTASVADGSYAVGQTIPIQVLYSEPVTVAVALENPTLTLNAATRRVASYVSGSGTRVLVFNYVVQPGDTTPDLDYISDSALSLKFATFRDSGGSDALLTLPAPASAGSLSHSKDIVIDTAPPAAPAVNALVTNVTKPIITGTATLGAGESLSVTVNGFTFNNVPVVANAWTLNLATATPASGTFTALPDAVYSVTATATDPAGNATSDPTVGELTIDTVPPALAVVNTLVTNVVKPTLTGTATLLAGETLAITINGFTYSNVPVVAGAWSLNLATATPTVGTFTSLADGTYAVTATTRDLSLIHI